MKIRHALTLYAVIASCPAAGQVSRFTYDALGRLIRTEVDGPGQNTTVYEYDPAGNRRTMIAGVEPMVVNGNFELPSIASYVYRPAAPGILFSGQSGISRFGDGWNFPRPWSGDQVAFVQSSPGATGYIEVKAVNLTPGARYQIAFAAAQRPGYAASRLQVFVDGSLVWNDIPASSAQFTPYPTMAFSPTSSSVVVRFASSDSAVETANAIDAVSVQRLSAYAAPTASNPTLNVASNTTNAIALSSLATTSTSARITAFSPPSGGGSATIAGDGQSVSYTAPSVATPGMCEPANVVTVSVPYTVQNTSGSQSGSGTATINVRGAAGPRPSRGQQCP